MSSSVSFVSIFCDKKGEKRSEKHVASDGKQGDAREDGCVDGGGARCQKSRARFFARGGVSHVKLTSDHSLRVKRIIKANNIVQQKSNMEENTKATMKIMIMTMPMNP